LVKPGAALRTRFGLAVFGVVLASCASPADEVVAVTASDTQCRVPRAALRAGNTTVRVANRAHSVTGVYVYDERGQVEGEIPDVARGGTRSLAMNLAPGDYDIVCRSGTNTKGIRTTISVTGSGGPHRTRADRRAELRPDRNV